MVHLSGGFQLGFQLGCHFLVQSEGLTELLQRQPTDWCYGSTTPGLRQIVSCVYSLGARFVVHISR